MAGTLLPLLLFLALPCCAISLSTRPLADTRSETGSVKQILVLVNPVRVEAYDYKSYFPDIQVNRVNGLDVTPFKDTQQMMAEETYLPMSEEMKAQWVATRWYVDNIKRNRALGSLACALGHYKMWMQAASMKPGEWAIILEDDAQPQTTSAQLKEYMSKLPTSLYLVHLGNRLCYHQSGSEAYAVTAEGAKFLMSRRFTNSDHMLGMVPKGKGMCGRPSDEGFFFIHAPQESNQSSMTKLLANSSGSF